MKVYFHRKVLWRLNRRKRPSEAQLSTWEGEGGWVNSASQQQSFFERVSDYLRVKIAMLSKMYKDLASAWTPSPNRSMTSQSYNP
ncbi:MAG: hypothetical protein AB7F59_09350 [Bdellovibrionales bacterium]